MKKNTTPKNGASKPQKVPAWRRFIGLDLHAISARVSHIAAVLGVNEADPTPAEAAAINVVQTVVLAMDRPASREARILMSMAELARGARKRGATFNADVVGLVGQVEAIVDLSPASDVTPAQAFMRLANDSRFAAELLHGLGPDAASDVVHKTFGKLTKGTLRQPVGVVIELLFAALQRGVPFDTTLSRLSKRAEIAGLVNEAMKRASET